ncbi:MAG: glutamate decarboxylase [Actinomycetes bacterium]
MPNIENNPREPGQSRVDDILLTPVFSRGGNTRMARHHFPEHGLEPFKAYMQVRDEAMLDGNARQNLATFVGTWMDDLADKLLVETADKNLIDKDEYPATAAIEQSCVRIMAELWHAPGETIGASTVGSSEACMLAGLAMKRRWQQARRAAGKPADQPNLVMSAAVQVVWERFCNYWDVEPRYVPVTLDSLNLTPEKMMPFIDENTIGVVGILGVTYTGSYEPIKDIAEALDDLQERTGLDVPLHVDGASGAMVAPFIQPKLVWDFRLPRVLSINTSGHKYGLVYPGVGWILWRTKESLPPDLVFHVSYLGGDMPVLGLNFSRPASPVLLQYYQIVRLGRKGYRAVHKTSRAVARYLSGEVEKFDCFELLTRGDELPVFAWRMTPGYTANWDLDHLSDRLREKGWQVPAYPMPESITDQTVMRIVVREGLSMDLASLLVNDIAASVRFLESLEAPMPRERTGSSFMQ